MTKAKLSRRVSGGQVDLTRPMQFRFGGREYQGFAGDTLASALLAHGVNPLGRSFKYHRPRGLMGVGVEEANILVQLGKGARSTPNVRATEVELFDGLEATPVNCWPSAGFDLMGVNRLLARFLPAGFYYKTFMWPDWRVYEGFIRKAAGLGKAPDRPDPDRYEARNAHCDVLVVGAGPAGLAAARAAADSGVRVMLVEQDSLLGGALLHDEARIDDQDGADWLRGARAQLAARPDVQVLTRTSAIGYFDHNALTLLERVSDEAVCARDRDAVRHRLWHVRAKRVVLATGALERPLVFPGNDRPGVMLAEAVRVYLRRYGVRAGQRAVLFTNNDEAYKSALALTAAGVSVLGVADLRQAPPPDLVARLAHLGVPVWPGATVVDTCGGARLTAVRIRDAAGGLSWRACDLLAMSGGRNPTVHLFSQSGGKLNYDAAQACFTPAQSVQAERSVGAAAGRFGLAAALADGHAAGLEAAAMTGGASALDAPRTAPDRIATPIAPAWRVEAEGKAFVDFLNDVTVDDIGLSARENFVSVEHLKRYTTLGMAPDQGKTSNVNALAIMAALTGREIEQVGVTRYRFPFTPTPLAALAGQTRGALFRPLRTMPGHDRHAALGALFEDYGGWARPSGYLRAGESRHEAEQREARAVRGGAGLFEGSPLGKIEVVGPDAARFLDRIYANTVSTLKPGKIRYGLMLNELGAIIDDGVAVRLSEDRFLICTSSGGADRIAAWLEEWLQCEWTDLEVLVAPVTTAYGVVTLTGPRARDILQAAAVDFDVSAEAFAHMSYREGRVAGLPARILRVSYTGEVSYEINVAANATAALWDALMAAGQAHGIAPVGIDAWDLLRTEKGFLHIGADTDGATTPLDVGWGHVLRKASDFVGRRSLTLPENQRADRLQLVGFKTLEPKARLPIGAHVAAKGGGSQGYVTSMAVSPVLGRTVAMGMLRAGGDRLGEIVSIQTSDGVVRAEITAPGGYDPKGERLNG